MLESGQIAALAIFVVVFIAIVVGRMNRVNSTIISVVFTLIVVLAIPT